MLPTYASASRTRIDDVWTYPRNSAIDWTQPRSDGFKALGERTVTVDADVLQADAGTRTTAITGFVALADVMAKLLQQGVLERSPIRKPNSSGFCGTIAG